MPFDGRRGQQSLPPAAPPPSRTHQSGSTNGPHRAPLRHTASRPNMQVAFVNAGVGTSHNGSASTSVAGSSNSSVDEPMRKASSSAQPMAAPASPSKERIRMAGIRADGVGGSHFKQKGDEQSNIQVVVRVRGTAPGEEAAQQPILSTSGPHCASINVTMDSPVSVTSINTAANSVQSSLVSDGRGAREKTYPFDHVFGPEADQGMVYQSVVGPVLNEVLSGYNCTIFAYGQTGTGKTHTMEGDLASLMGTYSPEAGIIPRTLYRLFHTLELSRDEYSVHASFVELYNEELRDLLSDEAPQPLTGGGGGNSHGLRMFEDKSKGVVIQGLEDVPMRDAEHGLRILRKGSQKRQIAATQCNESSSRSHCVFTLTIHVKETTAKGEDVLRTGKLNLVDLAGSENIGRSGAENKRAREAGMINQSLLTLGRVINALVEKSTHVPYRESKLTRLLQESLGGRTKTCIIATVSQERRNLEETLSTLDYALRAKSIRNKPEVNQRMTRAALIKEYVNEIERLKGDLLASREKNGIFLSPESWQTMQEEHDGTRAQVDELRRQGEVVESKMVSLKEQFSQNMQLLVKREAEAKAVRTECEGKEQEIKQILQRIDDLRQAEADERQLRLAYMQSEKRLDGVARSLRDMFDESSSDNSKLFAKLDRKVKVERKNRDLMAECQAALASLSNQLEARVSDFTSSQEQFTLDLSAQLREFHQRESDKLKGNRLAVEQKLLAVQSLAKSVGDGHKETKASIDGLAESIRKDNEELLAASRERSERISSTCQSLVQQVAQSHRDSLATVRTGIEETNELVMGIVRASRERATADRKVIEDMHTLQNEASQAQLQRLEMQNERLTRLLMEEREKGISMRDSLCKNIGQLVNSFCNQREQGFVGAIEGACESNTSAQQEIQSFAQRHVDHTEELLVANQSTRDMLKEKEKMAKAQRMRSETGFNQSNAMIERQAHEFTLQIVDDTREASEHAERQLRAVDQRVDNIREAADVSRQTGLKHFTEMRSNVEEALTDVAAEIQSSIEDVVDTCEVAVESIDEHRMMGEAFLQEQNAQLSTLRFTAKEYLTNKVHIDSSTGTTPQKRDWPSVEDWSLVTARGDRQRIAYAGDDSMAGVEGDLNMMVDAPAVAADHPEDRAIQQADEQMEEATNILSAEPIPPHTRLASKKTLVHSGMLTSTVRPSLPASAAGGMRAGVSSTLPLGERQINRYSTSQQPPRGPQKAALTQGSKTRPIPTSTEGSVRSASAIPTIAIGKRAR